MWGAPRFYFGSYIFLIHINDLAHVSKELFFLMYADDTNVFLNESNVSKLAVSMNFELNLLVDWLRANKLSLNVKKTQVFSPKRKSLPFNVNIQIEGQEIQQVDKTKFLGVLIDNCLSWKHHIHYIRNKIAKSIGIIFKAKHILNTKI